MMVRGEPTFPPATPYGIVELLLRSGIELEGAEVVVVGYGDLVGAPLSIMLAQDSIRGNATVTCTPREDPRPEGAHAARPTSWWRPRACPQLIGGDMIKPGATVIDVGRASHGGRPGRRRRVRRGRRGGRRDHAGARAGSGR